MELELSFNSFDFKMSDFLRNSTYFSYMVERNRVTGLGRVIKVINCFYVGTEITYNESYSEATIDLTFRLNIAPRI